MTGPHAPRGGNSATDRLAGLLARSENPAGLDGRTAPEHRCARCVGPFGKSAIPCPAEFPEIEERARRVAAYKAATEGQQQ